MAAWRDTLIVAGLEANENHWIEGNWSSASGSQAIKMLFSQYPEMDAVFSGNDQMALSILQAACCIGLRIPEDLGVVGFDNMPESEYFWPSLTTVQSEQYNVGRMAVDEVVKIIEAGRQNLEISEPASIMLTPSLVVRQSSLKFRDQKSKEVIETAHKEM